jgi:hypothetical protein
VTRSLTSSYNIISASLVDSATEFVIMSLFGRSFNKLIGRTWKPLAFPKEGFLSIPADKTIEEETIPGYVASRYYPVQIGEIFQTRYQVVGKLGYGVTSTVWLARDLRSVITIPVHGA